MQTTPRVAALSAVVVIATTGLLFAGPLNPPPGPVTSTGRTLQEVYDRIAPAGSADGRIPIAGGTAAVTLSQAGSYVLTGALVVNGTAITITAPGVTLDLNGYSVTGSMASVPTINIAASGDRAVVRNGLVLAGQSGVTVTAGAAGVRLEDLTINNPRHYGILIASSTCPGAVVRRCHVSSVGATTVAIDTRSVLGISAESNDGCRIEDCTVIDMSNNTASGTATAGIYNSGNDSIISGCVVRNSTLEPGSRGIDLSVGGAVYRNNTVGGYSTAYTGGTNGGGNF